MVSAALACGIGASDASAAPARRTHDAPASGAAVGGSGSNDAGVAVDPSKFEPGACVSYAPTDNDNHHTVFLDAGHGNIDPGGEGVTETGTTIYEAPSDLAITLDASKLLRAAGFRVVVSRTTATEVVRLSPTDLTGTLLSPKGALDDVAARDECANIAGATLLVGIYLNASTTPLNAGSVTGYDGDRPFAAKNLRFATLLQTDVLAALNSHGWQIPDGGVLADTTLGGTPLTTTAAAYHHLVLLGPALPGWFTTPSKMPGALIEALFISDPFEGSLAVSDAGQAAIAQGIAEAVEQYFDEAPAGASSHK